MLQHDTVYVTIYDVRYLATTYGGFLRDTVTTSIVPVYYKDIKRIQLAVRRNFLQRSGPALLMLGGGGYLFLNVLNGALYNQSVSGGERVRRAGIGAGLLSIGYALKKLFRGDGFSKPSQPIRYVNLSPKKA